MRQFVKSVEEKALGVKVLKGVRPDQQLVKVVNDQLVELMGGQQEDLNDPKDGPQVLIRVYVSDQAIPFPTAKSTADSYHRSSCSQALRSCTCAECTYNCATKARSNRQCH